VAAYAAGTTATGSAKATAMLVGAFTAHLPSLEEPLRGVYIVVEVSLLGADAVHPEASPSTLVERSVQARDLAPPSAIDGRT